MSAWLLLVALAIAAPEPSDHTLVYYNARMALREGQSIEAIKLWFLRNALEDQTGQVSPHDADFGSITWAALGDLGVCQDGQATDEAGAGVWPVALHNYVVRNMGRRVKARRPRPFDAFELGRQQRFVSVTDVLAPQEMDTVRLFRGGCLRPRVAVVAAGQSVVAKLSDRQVAASVMLHLLERARETLHPRRVRGRSTVEARIFDLHLQLTALAAREARASARKQARSGRQIGLSRASIDAMQESADTYSFAADSAPARILRASVDWPVDEWMRLSPERRLFLFDHARGFVGAHQKLDQVALGVVDALAAQGQGAQVQQWIARVGKDQDPRAQAKIWAGQRGARLLAMDRETGFRERGVIALHRGVAGLQQGDLPGALRALGFALQVAPESAAATQIETLALRWISFAAGQHQINDELLATLLSLVPRRDYALVLEDLMWRAAFHADGASFALGLRNQPRGGALGRRVGLMEPLASGDSRAFLLGVDDSMQRSPGETLRFLDQMLRRLEREDAEVREAQLSTLAGLRGILAPLLAPGAQGGRGARSAESLDARMQAIAEGLLGLGTDAPLADRVRSQSPTGQVFAGSVRLAPADALPWPFGVVAPTAPSVFTPLSLVPREWVGSDGALVFGWSVEG